MKRTLCLASVLYAGKFGKTHAIAHPAVIPIIAADGFVYHRIVNYSPDFMKAYPRRAQDAGPQGKEEVHTSKEN